MYEDEFTEDKAEILHMVSQITSAYVANHQLEASQLPELIRSVHNSLTGLGKEPVEAEKPTPAVPVRRSVQPDYIICLEDGRKLRMLKRYLKTRYNMTPDEYRERWGLPKDYPMVAPNYAAQRSELAKSIGLGRKREGAATSGRGRRRQSAAAA